MDTRTRDERGRYEPTYSAEEILAAVREYEPAGTMEVAEAVGCARQNADYRLRRLRDAGKVSSKKVGRTLVWFTAEEEHA
ncbi:helix-turn-helix domain-containing protein [Halomarina pelagica]|uniref:helix-turn-helix domain-containing protein n=1 Tax=Halomarina pelagica TaxID=2961599 RepID=UPI0020C4F43D|nr:helix-turn-helix domain-containing protein [Halomarina sp. BND7]